MFSTIYGTVKEFYDQGAVIEVSGLGFAITLADTSWLTLNTQAFLYLQLHWHQEQGPQLFGFKTSVERSLFNLIISCSGLGPKIALSVMRSMSPGAFIGAITSGDIKLLSSVDGIGAKKAEHMIVQLKDKAAKLIAAGIITDDAGTAQQAKKIHAALGALGYTRYEVSQALEHIKKTTNLEQNSFDDSMRKALIFLSKKTL